MNHWSETYAPLIGRIFIGGFFLWNGIQEVLSLDATVKIFIHAPAYLSPSSWAVLAIAIEVLGGMALIVGIQTRLAAALLAIYVLVTSVVLIGVSSSVHTQLFLQDMAIIGGLLYVSAFGSGRWSRDWRN